MERSNKSQVVFFVSLHVCLCKACLWESGNIFLPLYMCEYVFVLLSSRRQCGFKSAGLLVEYYCAV